MVEAGARLEALRRLLMCTYEACRGLLSTAGESVGQSGEKRRTKVRDAKTAVQSKAVENSNISALVSRRCRKVLRRRDLCAKSALGGIVCLIEPLQSKYKPIAVCIRLVPRYCASTRQVLR